MNDEVSVQNIYNNKDPKIINVIKENCSSFCNPLYFVPIDNIFQNTKEGTSSSNSNNDESAKEKNNNSNGSSENLSKKKKRKKKKNRKKKKHKDINELLLGGAGLNNNKESENINIINKNNNNNGLRSTLRLHDFLRKNWRKSIFITHLKIKQRILLTMKKNKVFLYEDD